MTTLYYKQDFVLFSTKLYYKKICTAILFVCAGGDHKDDTTASYNTKTQFCFRKKKFVLRSTNLYYEK
jgi:hypothetical protein